MEWLLKDVQLAELHKMFMEKGYISTHHSVSVANEMNISVAVVQKWYEHMRDTHTQGLLSKKQKYFRECP